MCFYTSSFCLMGLVDFLLPDVLPFFVFRVHSLHRSSFRLMDASAEAGKQHHRNSINDVGTKGESSKKIKPTKLPQRGPGIAMLEMFRIEEEKKKKDAAAASCSEPSAASSSKFCDASIFCQPSVFALVVHSAHPPPNPFTHFLGLNDSSSLVRPNHKIVALHRPEFNSSKDLLMWSSLQSCSSSIPAVQLPLHPLVIKNLSQPSMSGPGFEVEMEPPSIQIYPGSMNRSFIAEEQRVMRHISQLFSFMVCIVFFFCLII
ncbi:hypothetical protein AXF42_Ash016231 [Apostasia shenzhenica]|uniref:Uncharacterized protein n=1 Tax=Apostasia shenzhenica TaxID=1088818 RepID=A0A2I0AEY8_9ASPA|nr:hypothetical protein AXF42_Ash016231 [Apostasia shenzhenica]